MSKLIVYNDPNETEILDFNNQHKLIVARINIKPTIFVTDMYIPTTIVSFKSVIFIPKLGLISVKVKKEYVTGKITKRATAIRPTEKDIADTKKYLLPVEFIIYLNHTKYKEIEYDIFYTLQNHTDGLNYIFDLINYINDHNYKLDIGKPFSCILITITDDYDRCLELLKKLRGVYPLKEHLDIFLSTIGDHLEQENDKRKECDEDYDEEYEDILYKLRKKWENESLEK